LPLTYGRSNRNPPFFGVGGGGAGGLRAGHRSTSASMRTRLSSRVWSR